MWAVVARFVFHATVPGWTTVSVLVSLLAAVQLIMIGILGEYFGRIYEQVKSRPLYVVAERVNFAEQSANDVPAEERAFPRVVPVASADGDDLRAHR